MNATNGHGKNPFPGLRSFEPNEDYLFFGRDKETDELRKRLRTSRFLAVIGSSGSGKSSLVKSGLIPSLQAGFMPGAGSGWRIAMLRPGEDPIGNLVRALRKSDVAPALTGETTANNTVLDVTLRDSSLGVAEAVKHAMLPAGENVFVIVDQFEELFRFQRSRAVEKSGDTSQAFVKLLLDAARQDYAPVYVAITMRSEFIGDCMSFPGLPDAINDGLYLIPRMTRDELREAIAKPVAVARGTIAPRLVVRLLNESGDETDRLPVLQHSLMRTWDEWERDHKAGEPLDIRHYEAIGTLKTALSLHADEALADVAKLPRGQEIAERLFKTITEAPEEGRGVRRPASLARIACVCKASLDEVRKVVEVFRQPGRAFLQPPEGTPLEPDSLIDISHESLMRLWRRLIDWAKEEARSTEIYSRLSRSAKSNAAGQESLWRNPELQIALRWRKENRATADWAGNAGEFDSSMRFLDRSRNWNWLRLGAMAAAVLFVIVGLGLWVRAALQENERLQAKLSALSGEKDRETGLGREQTAKLTGLQAENSRLKGAVTEATKSRDGVAAKIETQKRTNAGAEQNIARLNEANQALGKRIDGLDVKVRELLEEKTSLETLARALSRQTGALESEKGRLEKEAGALRTRAAELGERARFLGYTYPQSATLASINDALQSERAAVALQRIAIPADFLDNDSLRRQIEELQRQLDQMRADRARQANEAGWIEKENGLLSKQHAALMQEIEALNGTMKRLEERFRLLQAAQSEAERQNRILTGQAAEGEARVAGLTPIVEKLRASAGDAQKKSNALAGNIDRLQREVEQANREIGEYMVCINGALDRLAQAAKQPGVAADYTGLLAVSTLTLAPYDPDASATPQAYNALWTALNRLDEKAAHELIAPGASGENKVGTAKSSAIAQQICNRIKRGYTPQEFMAVFPAGSDFNVWRNPCHSVPQ